MSLASLDNVGAMHGFGDEEIHKAFHTLFDSNCNLKLINAL